MWRAILELKTHDVLWQRCCFWKFLSELSSKPKTLYYLLLPESECMSVLDVKFILSEYMSRCQLTRVSVLFKSKWFVCTLQLMFNCEVLSCLKKRNKCTFESRSFHNMLHQHVSHVQCIMSCEETFYVHGHFPSSSGGRGGLRNPFPKKFVPALPCSPKFFLT